MRVLVTGGAGFIGSHYVRGALGDAWGLPAIDQVTVLDKLTYAGNLANLAPVADDPRLRFVEGDIVDRGLVDTLTAEADAVVHLAAETHVDRSIRAAGDFVQANLVGTQVLLDAALRHGVDKFVHVSSDEVYGSIETGSWDEEQPLRPSSPYSASKAGSDLLARSYFHTHRLPVCVTRCSNNYGPYQFPEKIIPLFITALTQGGTAPLYGDGSNVREWLHVDDHCRALHLVLESGGPGEVYNIGGGTELSNRHLAGRLLDACGADWGRVVRVADRPGHDLRYSVCADKIAGDLGFKPEVDFGQGLADTVGWYLDNRDWWRPLVHGHPHS